jgi:hypothetical protein
MEFQLRRHRLSDIFTPSSDFGPTVASLLVRECINVGCNAHHTHCGILCRLRMAMYTTYEDSKLVLALILKVVVIYHIPLGAGDLNEQVVPQFVDQAVWL